MSNTPPEPTGEPEISDHGMSIVTSPDAHLKEVDDPYSPEAIRANLETRIETKKAAHETAKAQRDRYAAEMKQLIDEIAEAERHLRAATPRKYPNRGKRNTAAEPKSK
jgi:hypothetical protein